MKGLWCLLGLATACAGATDGVTRAADARRQDLVIDVEVTGILKAIDSDSVGPPGIPEVWEYKIIRMAPEGARIEAGKEVLAFDPSQLERRLREYESEVASLSEEVGKTRAEASMANLDDRIDREEAEAKRRKAELKADKPADLTAELSMRTAVIDRDLSRREVEHRTQKDRANRRRERSNLALLTDRLKRAQARVAEFKGYIDQMSVKARRTGTIVYKQDYRGEKKKVGDGSWRGETILEIASLDKMAAQGQVDEVDASKVRKGHRVGLRLEAHSDVEHAGTVRRIATLVQTESPESRVKIAQLDIALEKTDATIMRPGMRFRGRIEVDRVAGVLQVPLEAIRVTARGPEVMRVGVGVVPVKLGRRSRDAVEVTEGLNAGDRVALETRAAAGKPGALGMGTP